MEKPYTQPPPAYLTAIQSPPANFNYNPYGQAPPGCCGGGGGYSSIPSPQVVVQPVAVPVPVYSRTENVGSRYQSELYGSCARGDHQRTTKYGACGIITAIFCFPFGLMCLLADREKSCKRCGQRL